MGAFVLSALTIFSGASGVRSYDQQAQLVDNIDYKKITAAGKPGGCTPWPSCKDDGGTDPPAGNQEKDWGYVRIGSDGARASASGSAIVAVLDTGVNAGHGDLAGVVVACFSGITRGDYDCNNRKVKDDDGHGTHVAGTIAALDNDQDTVGVAAGNVQIINGKVLGRNGGGWDDLAWAIRHATDLGADVISMSLGGDLSGATSIIADLQSAVDYAISAGVAVVAAAGNEGTCGDNSVENSWPAENNGVFTVGATGIYLADDSDWAQEWTGSEVDVMPCFSNNMPNGVVDVSAPGVYITATNNKGGVTDLHGTSMATPHVSAALALLMGNGASASNAQNSLVNGAIDIGYPNSMMGAGLIHF